MSTKNLKKAVSLFGPLAGLLFVMAIFAGLTNGDSLAVNNLTLIAEQSLILVLVAAGLFFVMTTGMLDLSVGGIVCTCCYVVAKVCAINIPLGLFLCVAVGVALGAFNGFVTAVLKVPSFLATLCTSYILKGLMTVLISAEPVTVPFELYDFDEFYFKVPLTIVLLVLTYIVFRHHKFGHFVRLIGSNELGASYSGIDVAKTKMLCYVLCGFLSSIAAFLTAVRTGTAAVTTGSDLMFNAMIALTLGGFPAGGGVKSRFSAAIIGAYMTYVLGNGLLLINVSSTMQQVIKGSIFLAVVILTSKNVREYLQQFFKRSPAQQKAKV